MMQQKELERYKEREKQREQERQSLHNKRQTKKSLLFFVALVLAGILVAGYIFYYTSSGRYDSFARCLAEKGVVMYGADFCMYTQEQRTMFGKSFKFINYMDFSKNPDVKITPTWEIDGKLYPRVQSFEKLSTLSGCVIHPDEA